MQLKRNLLFMKINRESFQTSDNIIQEKKEKEKSFASLPASSVNL